MPLNASLILKSESELEKMPEFTKNSLSRMIQLSFWGTHFSNHNFHLKKNVADWRTFQQIPFLSKDEFVKLGIKKRLFDAVNIAKTNPYLLTLITTSGTSKSKPTLLLRSAELYHEGGLRLKEKNYRSLFLFQSRTLSLALILAFILRNKEGEKNQTLFANPFHFQSGMIEPICQMNSRIMMSFPSAITYLTSTFPKTRQIFLNTKRICSGGDFLSPKQTKFMKTLYPNMDITVEYGMSEFALVGIGCKYLSKRYGFNSFHPANQEIVELINVDKENLGEVVVTKFDPVELGFIRYRTGDLAKATEENCPCGKKWMFSLMGRCDMDYFKCLGTLISRMEIERAINDLSNVIDEWRGEVREVEYKGSFLGELKLLIKLVSKQEPDIENLSSLIGKKLRLTPKKTLAQLVDEKKFMPLKIELVDQFPLTNKKVFLRKVLD